MVVTVVVMKSHERTRIIQVQNLTVAMAVYPIKVNKKKLLIHQVKSHKAHPHYWMHK
jgi:hypothetical protein